MSSRNAAYALVMRGRSKSGEVLLEQRSEDQTVMPGMWELPALRDVEVASHHTHLAVRHAIMQVNYNVRIRAVSEDDVEELTIPSASRRWVCLRDLSALPLTGLARKVLLRARLPELAADPKISESAVPAD